ncbi:MAG: glycosyltransferase family 39 protein [Pseudomonadota bacterium]
MKLTFPDFEANASTKTWIMRLFAVLALLLLFRLITLYFSRTDLFFDEAQYWSWSENPAFGYYSKPPIIAWLISLTTGACGIEEYCIRLSSPLLHTGTAIVVFAIATKIYDARVGFLSGLVFATLPGVSLSAGIISTDVPLLFFWALALLAFVYLLEGERRWISAVALGIALGLGLNAKYAMAYFILCAILYFAMTPSRREFLYDLRWWTSIAIAFLLILPNLNWNYENSFATFAHTADNAKWGGALFNPSKALEFFGSQFGVFGPILFGGLLVIIKRAYYGELEGKDRLLLAFALPVIAIVTVQAFLSRAHANWAAVSYVSATILVTATMVRELSWGWLRSSLAIHIAVLLLLGALVTQAGSFRLPNGQDPFARTLGWENIARATAEQLKKARELEQPFGSVLTLERDVTAELLYYLRGDKTPVRIWPPSGRPRDHYQLKRPYRGRLPDPILLVVIGDIPVSVADRFRDVDYLEVKNIAAGAGPPRRVTFAKLAGYKR